MYDPNTSIGSFPYEPTDVLAGAETSQYQLPYTFDQPAEENWNREQQTNQELSVESRTLLAIGSNLDFYRQRLLEMQEVS